MENVVIVCTKDGIAEVWATNDINVKVVRLNESENPITEYQFAIQGMKLIG